MKWIKNLEFWCFFLLLLNVATAAADFYFRRSAVALLPLPPGQSLAGPPGITLAGRPPATATCHLVRYASIKMLRRQAIHQEFLVFFWWKRQSEKSYSSSEVPERSVLWQENLFLA